MVRGANDKRSLPGTLPALPTGRSAGERGISAREQSAYRVENKGNPLLHKGVRMAAVTLSIHFTPVSLPLLPALLLHLGSAILPYSPHSPSPKARLEHLELLRH